MRKLKEVKNDRKHILKGSILSAFIKFSFPILLALLIQSLYGAVDLLAVGKFCGKADVSAVAAGNSYAGV